MVKVACLLVAVTACGDSVDPTTPSFDVNGVDIVADYYPAGLFPPPPLLAAGGTEPIAPTEAGDALDASQLYIGPPGILAFDGGVVHGITRGSGYIELLDSTNDEPLLVDELGVAAFDHAVAVPANDDFLFAQPTSFAWMTGSVDVGIALFDDRNERLIDTSLLIDGAAQPRWDEVIVHDAGAGHYGVAIETGEGKTATVDVEVVDHVASIVLANPGDFAGADACFTALADDGAFIAGLQWSFTVNGVPTQGKTTCVPLYGDLGATFTVTASAGGVTATSLTTN
jgi:hypothetical protein